MGNILIVNDEEDISMALTKLLNDEGYDVTRAINSYEMKTLMKRENFDAIIVELFIGEEDGFELLDMVQNIDEELPFIMITDSDNEHLAIQSIEMGAYDYLIKPMIYTDIINTVDRAIEKRRLSMEKNKWEESYEVASYKYDCISNIIDILSYTENNNEAIDKLLLSILNIYQANYCNILYLEENSTKVKVIAQLSEGENIYETGKTYNIESIPTVIEAIKRKKVIFHNKSEETKKEKNLQIIEIPLVYMGSITGTIHIEYSGKTQEKIYEEKQLPEMIGKHTGIFIENLRLKKEV